VALSQPSPAVKLPVVKYCPNLGCPHRRRVKAPAEFVDRVTACSDCETPLVDSEEEAIAGLQAGSHGPYRSALTEAAPAAQGSTSRDRLVGAAFLGGGLLLTLFTLMTAQGGNRSYVVAWGPMVYGVYRLIRGQR
jgi:hypothetical protein